MGQPVRRGNDPDPDDDRVAAELAPVFEHQLLHVAIAPRPFEAGRQQDLDTLTAVQVHEPTPDLLAEDRGERCRQRLEEGHLDTQPTGGCRHLLPDEPGSDHDQARPGSEGGAQRPGVREGAQVMDVGPPIKVGKAARPAPGGDQQLLVLEGRPVIQLELSGGNVQPHGSAPEDQLDLVLLVPVVGPKGDRLLVHRAGQELLGEGRSVIGRLGLGTDDPNRGLVSAGPERSGAALGCQAPADDHDSVVPHAGSSLIAGWAPTCMSGRWWRGARPCGFGAGRSAFLAPCPLRRAPTSRATKRTAITGTVANSQIRIQGVEASVPAPRVWATASA